jgi:hypothetical protein
MPETLTSPSQRGHLWEWWAELDTVVNLLTGERVAGHRVHYRANGARRWSTFLLTTSDGSTPTTAMIVRAMDAHSENAGG